MEETAERLSEIVDFRSMLFVEGDQALTQVKAVDAAYPILGEVVLDPPIPLSQALADNGAVVDRVLADRLGLSAGDVFRLGTTEFRLSAILLREPDSAVGGLGLGPRTILRTEDLEESGLLAAGTLFETEYRLLLPPEADLDAVEARVQEGLDGAGARWQVCGSVGRVSGPRGACRSDRRRCRDCGRRAQLPRWQD
jgi:putative ABC transport system permease protein